MFCAVSGVEAQKSAAAQEAYNSRTLQCREALSIIAAEADMDSAADYASLIETIPPKELLRLATKLPDLLAQRFLHVVSEAGRVADGLAGFEAVAAEHPETVELKVDLARLLEAAGRGDEADQEEGGQERDRQGQAEDPPQEEDRCVTHMSVGWYRSGHNGE